MFIQAPGKVFLLGEYAVLDGCPAIVAAVDRGVQCRVRPSETLQIETPGGDDRYVRPAILSAPQAPAGHYQFEPWNPTATQSKPGLGGSASATVAALRAALALAGETPDAATLTLRAAQVHHGVQGGGSGVDVAACVHGGLARYDGLSCTPLPPVEPVVVFSGGSAATGPRVQQYLQWADRASFTEACASLAQAFPSAPTECLREACARLDAMSREAGLAYWTEGLRRICALAQQHGGAAKPSGAGGGDCAVALFDDPDDRVSFIAACEQDGWAVIPVHLAPGVTVHDQEPLHE